jgi:mannose-1-phosphate guanylyltransferase/mannose-6-phosphate isomerase
MVLVETLSYKVKILEIFPHEMTSLQSHQHRKEVWTIVGGCPTLYIEPREIECGRMGNSFFVSKNQKHRIINKTEDKVVIVEVQIGESFSEDDIIRFDDKYGRGVKV